MRLELNIPPARLAGRYRLTQSALARGFTLVETMIAMTLLGLVLAGSFALLVSSYSTMRRTQETLYVSRILESAIEMTRNLSFEEVKLQAADSPITFDTESSLLPLFGKVNDTVDDEGYQMELAESSGEVVLEEINENLYRVTASVTWSPFRLAPSTRTVATYISSNGINRR